jgi:type II secretory pathway component PulF
MKTNVLTPKCPVAVLKSLSLCLDKGITLFHALSITAEAQHSAIVGKRLMKMRSCIVQGETFSKAFSRVFRVDTFTHSMIPIYEESGKLSQGLLVSAESRQFAQFILRNSVASLLYPAFLLAGAFSLGYMLINKVLPVITSMGISREKLPLVTRALIWLGDYILIIGVGLLLTIFATLVFHCLVHKKSYAYRYSVQKISLALPVLRNLTRARATYIIFTTLVTHIHSGLPLSYALNTLNRLDGKYIGHKARLFAKDIEQGAGFAVLPQYFNFLHHSVVTDLKIAEFAGSTSGCIESIAKNARSYYEQALMSLQKTLTPLALMLAAGVILLVSSGLLMPIYQVSQSMYAK